MRVAALAVLLLAGCAEREPTVIDGSSPESFERTTDQARRESPDTGRLVFDVSLATSAPRSIIQHEPADISKLPQFPQSAK